jgi:DNA-directed RNA polymerase subunit RPC12/RpoP
MRITYACPACHATVAVDGIETRAALDCPACGVAVAVPGDAFAPGTPPRLRRCLVCPSTELFVRKDFPQRVGLAIVVAGLAASCVAWAWRELVLTFAILFGTALVDVVLYLVMPDCLSCYRCGARYRGAGVRGSFGGFDLETHEKHRQQTARLRAGSAHGS